MGADKEDYLENMPKYLDVDTQEVSDKSFLQLVRQWIKEKRISAKVYVAMRTISTPKAIFFSIGIMQPQGIRSLAHRTFQRMDFKEILS